MPCPCLSDTVPTASPRYVNTVGDSDCNSYGDIVRNGLEQIDYTVPKSEQPTQPVDYLAPKVEQPYPAIDYSAPGSSSQKQLNISKENIGAMPGGLVPANSPVQNETFAKKYKWWLIIGGAAAAYYLYKKTK